jgi:hypothetical protein
LIGTPLQYPGGSSATGNYWGFGRGAFYYLADSSCNTIEDERASGVTLKETVKVISVKKDGKENEDLKRIIEATF